MLILVLGGARSGKSRYAQSLCDYSSHVVYIATAGADADDYEMRERIARHRADRPADWQTVEESLDLSRAIRAAPVEATLLIDCATLWISNLMWKFKEESGADQNRLIFAEIDKLIDAVRGRAEKSITTGVAGEVVIVSNEVGAGSVANPRALQKQPPYVTPAMVERLTREVHRLESLEGILSDWALPGDHSPAAAYDLARTVCRRAERSVVRLREAGEEVEDEVIRYLNRLSDLLWLFGRTLELRAGVNSRLRDEASGGNQFSRAW